MSNLSQPSPVELQELPRRAIVAFAARRAGALLHLVEIAEGDPDIKVTPAGAEAAVCLVERYASGGSVSAEEVSQARAVVDALFSASLNGTGDEAGNVIFRAVSALESAVRAPHDKDAVAGHATNACLFLDEGADQEELTEASRADFELLLAAARREGWDEDTPVAPTFFEE